MAIIKYNPFDPFEDFSNLFTEGISGMKKHSFSPAADVYEEKNKIIVKLPLAGVDPENIEMYVENDVLSISGETKKESEIDEKNYYRKEIRSGNFFRTIPLPQHVQGNRATAEFDSGVVTIHIPKAEEKKLKKIKIAHVKKSKK